MVVAKTTNPILTILLHYSGDHYWLYKKLNQFILAYNLYDTVLPGLYMILNMSLNLSIPATNQSFLVVTFETMDKFR